MIFATWKPPADVFYSGNHWVIKIELAGIAPSELQIEAQGARLLVRGRRRDLLLQRGFSCHSLEISYCDFERNINLPSPIVRSSINWEYRDGMLQIQLNTRD